MLALACLLGCIAAEAWAQRLVDALLDRAGGRRIEIDD
jgi:hypothetical protein